MEKVQISMAAARVNARMTQTEAAREMSVSKNTIVNWEKGLTSPTVPQARKLASIYGIPLDYIFLPGKSN